MITARELRARARTALANNWGMAIIACLIYGLIIGGLSFTFVGSLIVGGPLMLGLAFFFMDISRNYPGKIEAVFRGFNNFSNSLVLFLLQTIFIILWSWLLFIPGIIKAYAYSMSYYIMADNPQISGSDAITQSRQMMDGNKWRLFCLDLSFIGWAILCMFTFGIGLLWLMPYMQESRVQFYEDLKAKYMQQAAPSQPQQA